MSCQPPVPAADQVADKGGVQYGRPPACGAHLVRYGRVDGAHRDERRGARCARRGTPPGDGARPMRGDAIRWAGQALPMQPPPGKQEEHARAGSPQPPGKGPRITDGDGQATDRLARLQLENEQLKQAMESRPVIDMARGVLMGWLGCSPEEHLDSRGRGRGRERVRPLPGAVRRRYRSSERRQRLLGQVRRPWTPAVGGHCRGRRRVHGPRPQLAGPASRPGRRPGGAHPSHPTRSPHACRLLTAPAPLCTGGQ
jgi:hypothetical protein